MGRVHGLASYQARGQQQWMQDDQNQDKWNYYLMDAYVDGFVDGYGEGQRWKQDDQEFVDDVYRLDRQAYWYGVGKKQGQYARQEDEKGIPALFGVTGGCDLVGPVATTKVAPPAKPQVAVDEKGIPKAFGVYVDGMKPLPNILRELISL